MVLSGVFVYSVRIVVIISSSDLSISTRVFSVGCRYADLPERSMVINPSFSIRFTFLCNVPIGRSRKFFNADKSKGLFWISPTIMVRIIKASIGSPHIPVSIA